jgi:thiosulfate/3-mercaptopyruvate sulfurtransferase
MKTIKRFTILAVLIFSLTLTLTGCMNDTSYTGSSNVVEVTEVAAELGSDGVIVVDARDADVYAKGHLEGAINIPTGKLVSSYPVKASVLSKSAFEKLLGAKGISNDSKVYIYDDAGGVYSSRVWWTFKLYGHATVEVVNGGAKALVKEGLNVVVDVPELPKTTYTAAKKDMSLLASMEDVKVKAEDESNGAILLDVRSTAEFAEGSIPNAILFPHTENLYKDGTFKSASTIELNYKDKKINKEDTVLVYCKSSFRAAQTMLLLNEAGYENVKLYDGAWIQWSESGLPITGAETAAPITAQDAS